MKRLLTVLCVAGGMLAGVNTAGATQSVCDADLNNPVMNCGFETGTLADWNTSGAVAITGQANNGYYAANMFVVGGQAELSQTVVVTSGEQYSVSFYLWDFHDGGATQSFLVETLDHGTQEQLGSLELLGAQTGYGAYTKANFDFTAVSSQVDLDFILQNRAASGWDVDDVQVDPAQVPEPASLALLGTALAGLAALRRRRKASPRDTHSTRE